MPTPHHVNGARPAGDESDELGAAYARGLVADSTPLDGARRRRQQAKAPNGQAPVTPPADTYHDLPDEPGHAVLDDVARWLSEHVAYASEHHAPAVALWAAHTHALSAAASTPRLAFVSPEPGSGKTRSLELLELLVHQGRHVLSMTPAALFRVIEAHRPTILLDEVDAIFGPKASKDHEDLRRSSTPATGPG